MTLRSGIPSRTVGISKVDRPKQGHPATVVQSGFPSTRPSGCLSVTVPWELLLRLKTDPQEAGLPSLLPQSEDSCWAGEWPSGQQGGTSSSSPRPGSARMSASRLGSWCPQGANGLLDSRLHIWKLTLLKQTPLYNKRTSGTR